MKRKARQLTGCDRNFLAELDRVFDALGKMDWNERRRAVRWACDRFEISGKHLADSIQRAAS